MATYSRTLSRRLSKDEPDEARGEYRLKKSAEDCYEHLASKRQAVEDIAEQLAEITIPSSFPPRDWNEGDPLYVPNQSINSGAVNNAANTLAYTAFPPGLPMLSYTVAEHRLRAEAQADPELWGMIELALSRLEEIHRKRLETTTLKTVYVQYLLQLFIAGAALWRHRKLAFPTCHTMREYVVKRDNLGRPLYCILRECIELDSLDKETEEFIRHKRKLQGGDYGEPKDDEVYIYTCVRWDYSEKDDDPEWYLWQEIDGGHMIPDTEEEGKDSDEPCPLYPGWIIPAFGHDWGRSYCEEYRGDLYQVENGHNSMNDLTAVAGWSLVLVSPTGVTNREDVVQADSLDVIAGKEEDVTIIKTDKAGDAQTLVAHGESAEKRVQRAFLMYIAVQRSGERVTREEILRMSQDIDKAAGGLHTQVSQTSQKHIVRRAIWLHEKEDNKVPKLPEGVFRVSVVTGQDALGRAMEDSRLQEYGVELGLVFGPQAVATLLNPSEFARRKAAAKGIKPDGLVQKPQEVAAQAQQAQQQELLGKVAAPVAGEAAKAGFSQMAANAQNQQPQQAQ